MKPIFTIHEGEFLVGDYINRRFGRKFEVWVPTKDSGVDLLVTSRRRRRKALSVQAKFSRSYDTNNELARHVIATSWYRLDPKKIRSSQADLWVFVIMTLRHEQHFVVIPTRELRKRIPRDCGRTWDLYLWVYADRSCYQVRDLCNEERLNAVRRGVRDAQRDFSPWLGNWKLLDKFTR